MKDQVQFQASLSVVKYIVCKFFVQHKIVFHHSSSREKKG